MGVLGLEDSSELHFKPFGIKARKDTCELENAVEAYRFGDAA